MELPALADDPLMPKVTTLDCSLTGLAAAFLVGAEAPFDASVAALACYAAAFLDALHAWMARP